VTYGEKTFVVVGDGGTVLASSGDGWNQIESGVTQNLAGIAWANGTFVAVGSAGTVLTSTNGTNWTLAESGVSEPIRCVTFGADRFLALGATNALVSLNGITWSNHPIPAMNAKSVCYGNGRFVSAGGSSFLEPRGEIRESTDGTTWRLWPQGTCVYYDILYGGGYFTAVGEGVGTHLIHQSLLWRAPGIVEQGGSKVYSVNVESPRGVAVGDGVFISVGGTRAVPNPWWIGTICSSETGDSPWTSLDHPVEPWPQTYFQLDHLLLDVAFGSGKFVAVGENGTLVESGPAARFDPRQSRGQPDGSMELGLLSPIGSQLHIEMTTDFQTWSNVSTVTNTSGSVRLQVSPQGKPAFVRATLQR
jgi:hypothetical protein